MSDNTSPQRHVNLVHSFAEIVAAIPRTTARTHHGRSPDVGFDCVGLPIYVYREAGYPIDDIDKPYEEQEADDLNRRGWIESQLAMRLRDVTPQVTAALDKDGDIWVFGIQQGLRHAGIFVAGTIIHMADRLYERDAARVRPYLKRAYRRPVDLSLF